MEGFVMRIALSVVFLAVQVVAAQAQTAAEREACQANFEKFCKGVVPGGGRVIQCLTEHFSELTPECQKVVKANTPG
ncbi:cysteine rich repeat-containing protein [Mesorhizobium newzealandense]|uniref:Cysteine rich repeat-containing protein n=1 Tax=Mesorhizobium newzealandense TaxID=1300302 RepID=A0ABW4UIR5_9HYPH